jgi:hypothetical protein
MVGFYFVVFSYLARFKTLHAFFPSEVCDPVYLETLEEILLKSHFVWILHRYNFIARCAAGPALGKRMVAGRVVSDSYGAAKQQHTFTVRFS